jgi:2'-5' RNA ligase
LSEHGEDSDVRVFFALWPDGDTRARIANAVGAVGRAGGALLVPPQNYHATLAFVGEIPMSQLAVLQQIGRGQRAAGCTIEFDTYEYWPDSRVAVAVASETPAALTDLCMRLHRDMEFRGVVPKPGRPHASLRVHITLARKVAQAAVLQAMSPIQWQARSFSLVSSDTSGKRSVYTVVDTWSLLDEPRNP